MGARLPLAEFAHWEGIDMSTNLDVNSQLTLSIVTVVRNDLSGLRHTAEKILPQLNWETEWIIVDGNSEDGTSGLIQELESFDWVRTFKLPPKGIYDAMNFGFQVAQGPWCWFLNAGDSPFSDKSVSEAIFLIKSSGPVSMIGSSVVYFLDGFMFSFVRPWATEPGNNGYCGFHHQGALIKREALLKLEGFRTDLSLTADGELLDKLFLSYETSFCEAPLASFALGGASTKQYHKALRETNSFRPSFYSFRIRQELVVKNAILRVLLMVLKRKIKVKLVVRYLSTRDTKIRRELDQYMVAE